MTKWHCRLRFLVGTGSGAGMALTGYTRNGRCVDQDDDRGSHHVCIDLASTEGGNFCTVTGQSDWCSSSMGCDGGGGGLCPVNHWCVCQWAFASYIKRAGGCSKIQGIVCEATNAQALKAYKMQAPKDPSIAAALACLEERCGLDDGDEVAAALKEERSQSTPRASATGDARSAPPTVSAEAAAAAPSAGMTVGIAASAGLAIIGVLVIVVLRTRGNTKENFAEMVEEGGNSDGGGVGATELKQV